MRQQAEGMHAVCLAYRKGAWSPLASGSEDVGEDFSFFR